MFCPMKQKIIDSSTLILILNKKKKYINSYYVLVLICEYVAEPIYACPEERKLWKKRMIDVHAVKKKTEILCMICRMKQRNKILVFDSL